jgi:hypothetical protein
VSALPRLSSLSLSSEFKLVRRDCDSSGVGKGKVSSVERMLLFLTALWRVALKMSQLARLVLNLELLGGGVLSWVSDALMAKRSPWWSDPRPGMTCQSCTFPARLRLD